MNKKPSSAFVGASWVALAVFSLTYLTSLWRMNIPVVENYFYISALAFALFGTAALAKSIRDKEDGIPVTSIFLTLSWIGTLLPIGLMSAYLLQVSSLDELQRGMLFITFAATVFAVVAVQKCIRDLADWRKTQPAPVAVDFE
jgi:uncharacterized membrane protein YiaA